MAIKHNYTIVCDDVRQEINHKFIILGIYNRAIAVPQIPFLLPSLSFWTSLDSDRPGNWGIKFRIQHLESGRMLLEGAGQIQFQQPGVGPNFLKFNNVGLIAPGTYNFVLEIEGQANDPIIVPFDVILNIQHQNPFVR